MKFFGAYAISILLVIFSSCVDKPQYPSKPVIAYKDFIRYGSDPSNPDSTELVVSFTDNEGDVGLTQADVHGVFSEGNIFMDWYFWDTLGMDHWVAMEDPTTAEADTFRNAYRVPPVLPKEDSEEPVKGFIYVKQKPFIPSYRKIKFVVYLYDRGMNKSDTIHTPAIIF